MFFIAQQELVVGGKPVFIGWLEQYIDWRFVPITVDDIDSITFSLFYLGSLLPGDTLQYPTPEPIEEWQNIIIDKTKVITAPTTYEPEFYRILELTPFQSNFIYAPPNVPPVLQKEGLYEARFQIVDSNSEIHPATVRITVR